MLCTSCEVDKRGRKTTLTHKYISNHSLASWTLVRSFLSRPKYAIRGTGILGRIWLGSSAAFGGGSNAPRPAVSVPHIDVNADGCRARRASVEEEF